MNAPLFSELLAPVKALLEANELTVQNISEVQVIGGKCCGILFAGIFDESNLLICFFPAFFVAIQTRVFFGSTFSDQSNLDFAIF